MVMIFVLLALVAPAAGSGFLQKVDTHAEVEASLLAEFASTFRPGASKDNILILEAALRPMFNAVSHKPDGTLQHTVVRYVLHRFFAQRGWFIRGLEPGTGAPKVAWNSAGDSLQALQEWVPTFLQDFLVQLAGGRGISLRELAILAATFEDLVHKETISYLKFAFQALELSLDTQLNQAQVSEVLKVFMMTYREGGKCGMLGESPNRTDVQRAHNYFTQHDPEWGPVQKWVRTIQHEVHPDTVTLDFDAMRSIVEKIGASYGTYSKKGCASLKAELLDAESQKAGRVQLGDFYNKGKSGTFLFAERVEYLRALGALDETDPKQPQVIIPNYVSSRPNCEVVSEFYVICCNNECEDLTGKLENSIASEIATPEQIIQIVSGLPSDTVVAPRFLSATLKQRLHSIAESNAGKVPLHGRLFALWMHHAFPRECPFPHKDGSTYPQTPDEWINNSGYESSKASAEEMKAYDDSDNEDKPKGSEARKSNQFEEHELLWSEAEEPIKERGGSEETQPQSSLRTISSFTILCSMGSVLVWASKSLLDSVDWQGSSFTCALGKVQMGSKDGFGKML